MVKGLNVFAVPYALTVLGISHVITQITVIREFINVASGNEVVVGLLFSLWLLVTGIGAWLGRFASSYRMQNLFFRLSLFFVAFLPIIHIILIRFLRDFLFTRGELPGLGSLIMWAAALLTPYCLITGGLLTIACSILPSAGPERLSIGKVYFFDNIGDILGGIIFTFILIRFFNNLTILYVPAFLCLSGLFLIERRNTERKWCRAPWTIAGTICLIFMVLVPLEKTSLQWLYRGQTIVDHRESPYGRIVVTKHYDQISFFENGEHIFSTPNIFANEELVHYALPQREIIESVLLVSGGVSGIIGEIEKYGVHRIDYVELDPSIITAATDHLKIRFPPSVHVHEQDGRTFIEKATHRYDALILDLPDPSSLQLNRFYTLEFFTKVKSILSNGGIVSFAVSGAENFISDDQARFLSTLYNTLKRVFAHVLIIPGDRNIFIVSDTPLSADIASLLTHRGIATVYVNRNFLEGRLTDERLSFINRHLQADVPANHDFRPTAFYYSMRLWLSMFREHFRLPLGAAALFFIVYAASIGTINRTVLSTGFTASSMEVIILLCYQIVHGSVYTGIGLIIAAFMLGLAAGSFLSNQLISVSRRTLIIIELGIIFYLVTYMAMLGAASSMLSITVFSIMALLIGILTGAEFPVAGRLEFSSPGKTAGSLYAADLLGGSVGAFTVSLYLIPAVGMYITCLLMIALKLLIIAGLLVRIRS